ncbi:MAG: hydrogenase maturation nickel metallochaperone HypA [Desulfovibrio sp.]|nr:hydrogenase maturation nickel metallochaperone HypA [Desulfovibrio sp.]
MHEASLAQGLLDLVLNSLEEYNRNHPDQRGGKIKEIVCGAGLFAGFEDFTLRSCFELFAEGTVCEGADLKIDLVPLDCVCRRCGEKFRLSKRPFRCSNCGGDDMDFKGGAGLTLLAINVDSEDERNHD